MWSAGRIAIFLLKLALLVPLLFWIWGRVQPSYSGLITALADGAIGIEEWGVRVTHLALADTGDVIHVLTPLRQDGEPANTYNARVLHFYVVPTLAVVLAFPGLAAWRRVRVLGAVFGTVALFQVIALVITVEHTYAVTLSEIARRNYTPAEQAVYSWLMEGFAFLAVQGVPAAALILLFALYGPLRGRGQASGSSIDAAGGGAAGSPDLAAGSGGEASASSHLAAMTRDGDLGKGPQRDRENESSPGARGDEAAPPRGGPPSPGAGAGAAIQRETVAAAARVERAGGGRPAHRSWPKMAAGAALAAAAVVVIGAWEHRGKVRGRQAETLVVWGQRALAKDDLEKAEEFFSSSIGLKPAFAHAHAGLARCLVRRGDTPDAIDAMGHAIRLDPTLISWHLERARLLATTGRLAEAEEALAAAVERWPGEPSLSPGVKESRLLSWYEERIKFLLDSGRPAEAEESLRVAAGRWPDVASVRLNLSILLARANRLCEAMPHLETFLALAPGDREAAAVAAALAQARERCGAP